MIYQLAALVLFLGCIAWVLKVKDKRPLYYGVLAALIGLTWWALGLIYSLGQWAWIDLLTENVYNALGPVIAGPFTLVSEYILGGHTHYLIHILFILVPAFAIGWLYGRLKERSAIAGG